MAIVANSQRYTDAVKELFPRGKFFDNELQHSESDLSKIANIKGQEIYAFKLKMKELLDESNLLTCTEKTIADYERIYGLEIRDDLTLEQRKAIIKNFRGDTLNIVSLNSIAVIYNARIKKVEYPHRPARFGESRFAITRIFDVRVFSVVYVHCTIGNVVDKTLEKNKTDFESAITNMMLANMIIYFKYEESN